jgi:hypothetical protein
MLTIDMEFWFVYRGWILVEQFDSEVLKTFRGVVVHSFKTPTSKRESMIIYGAII